MSVNGVRWDEAPGLYGEGPDAQVYAGRVQDDGTTVIQFGDGRTGATRAHRRAATSPRRTARRRASPGRVRARTLTSALDRPPGLNDVVNPLAAHGGADPEAIAGRARPTRRRPCGRSAAPSRCRLRRPRARLAARSPRRRPIWVWDGLDRAVHLTVAGQSGGIFTAEDLRAWARRWPRRASPSYRLLPRQLLGVPGPARARRSTVDRHYVRADVLAAARAALLDALAFDAVELGDAGAPQRHVPRHPGRRRRRLGRHRRAAAQAARRSRPPERRPRWRDGDAGAAAAARADLPARARPGATRAACCPPSWRASRTRPATSSWAPGEGSDG